MPRVATIVVSLAGLLALVAACKGGKGSKSPEGDASSGIKEIAVGQDYVAALFNDGHIRVRGPTEGQLRKLSFDAKVVHLAAGREHACVQLETGATRCIGRNAWGGLGVGNTEAIKDPSHTVDLELGGKAVDLSAGHGYSCAVLDDATVRCWGTGQGGRLGYGNRNDITSASDAGPVPVGGPVRTIVAGPVGVTCAVLVSGSVRCWGQALQGVLGYGTANDVGASNTPESVGDVALPAKAVQVAVGSAHVCALLEGGRVRCWGFGDDGRLGYPLDGNIGDDETPADAKDVDIGGNVTALAAGGAHTCALLDTGSVRCWGIGTQGQLGYGDSKSVGDERSPAEAGDVPLDGKAKQLVAGPEHTCALLESGDVVCWGAHFDGITSSPKPMKIGFVD